MKLVAWIDAVTDRTGRALAWLMLLMVLVTAAVVVLRYAFGQSSIILQESVMYLHGVAFMLAIPYALKRDAHVRVDLIYGRLGVRSQSVIDLLGHLLFLVPLALTILVTSRPYVANAWSMLEGSPEVGGIPAVFLLKSLIPLMAVLLLAQALAESVRLVVRLRSPGSADA